MAIKEVVGIDQPLIKIINIEDVLLIKISRTINKLQPIHQQEEVELKAMQIVKVWEFNIYRIRTLKPSFQENSQVKALKRLQHMKHRFLSMN